MLNKRFLNQCNLLGLVVEFVYIKWDSLDKHMIRKKQVLVVFVIYKYVINCCVNKKLTL